MVTAFLKRVGYALFTTHLNKQKKSLAHRTKDVIRVHLPIRVTEDRNLFQDIVV